MYGEIRQIRKQEGSDAQYVLVVQMAKKKIFFGLDCGCSMFGLLHSEQFPLAVQIIFQKKQMLQALRKFLKCRRVVVNLKTLDTGGKAKA